MAIKKKPLLFREKTNGFGEDEGGPSEDTQRRQIDR